MTKDEILAEVEAYGDARVKFAQALSDSNATEAAIEVTACMDTIGAAIGGPISKTPSADPDTAGAA